MSEWLKGYIVGVIIVTIIQAIVTFLDKRG